MWSVTCAIISEILPSNYSETVAKAECGPLVKQQVQFYKCICVISGYYLLKTRLVK